MFSIGYFTVMSVVGFLMTCKGCGCKQSWPNGGSGLAFAWGDSGKPQKVSSQPQDGGVSERCLYSHPLLRLSTETDIVSGCLTLESLGCYELKRYKDRLCGLVVRVLGYRSRGPGSIPRTTKKKISGSGMGSTLPREYN
jgi:hypothetical protein